MPLFRGWFFLPLPCLGRRELLDCCEERLDRKELPEERDEPPEEDRDDPRGVREVEDCFEEVLPFLRSKLEDFFRGRPLSFPLLPEAPRESRDFPEGLELERLELADDREEYFLSCFLSRARPLRSLSETTWSHSQASPLTQLPKA